MKLGSTQKGTDLLSKEQKKVNICAKSVIYTFLETTKKYHESYN